MTLEPQSILEYFFYFGERPAYAEEGVYITYLVVLSYIIASLGSFTGLRLATDIHKAPTARSKSLLHIGGAFAFGAGIWSMHFIGMLAYKMDMAIAYDPFLTVLSMFIAVFIAYGVLQIIRSGALKVTHLAIGSILLGLAICGMHYTGMAAMEMDGDLRYMPGLFALSVAIAITASGAALWIVFTLGQHEGRWKLGWQIIAAMVMGAAICGMHYTGIMASVFLPWADCRYDPNQSFDTLALSVAITSSAVFAIAITLTLNQDNAPKSEKKNFTGNTVFLQLAGLLGAFLILLVGSYIFLSNSIRHQANDHHLLSAASVQRAFIAQYVASVSIIVSSKSAGDQEEVEEHEEIVQQSKGYMDLNYGGLLNGGEVILNLEDSSIHSVHGLSDAEVIEAIRLARIEWESLKGSAIYILQSGVQGITYNPRYEEFENQFFVTIRAQDKAVDIMQSYLDMKDGELIFLQKIMLGGGVFLFLLTLLYARYFVAAPIEKARRELDEHRTNLQSLVLEKTRDALRLKDEAERASQAKSDFLANMSHELRTPLNSVLGLSRLLEESEMAEDDKGMVGTVHKSASTLLDIVNDILDISKIEAGGLELEEIGFDFRDMVENVMETMAPVASAKGISLKYNFSQDDLPYLRGDPFRLSRILTNLVSNAIKYTDKGGIDVTIGAKEIQSKKVDISTYEVDTDNVDVNVESRLLNENQVEIICTVKDSGIGIPEDKLQTIFEKFTQADESITRRFGGTGLGLSITKELVEMMGGEIGVESEVGKGSSFWFKIPFDISDRLAEKTVLHDWGMPDHAQTELIPVEAAKVLVAEDHLLNQDLIKRLLKRMGFKKFDLVENGALAFKAYDKNKYDLILMDCHMPEKNGYEATKEIRLRESGASKHTPIIALTADAMSGTKEKCIHAGMDVYITKPIDADRLQAVLSQWVAFSDYDRAKSGEAVEKDALVDLALLEQYADEPDDMKDFVEVFIKQSEESIKIMAENCCDGPNHEWVEAAHKFKGGAGMIGAKQLHSFCERAQSMSAAFAKDRKLMLKDIVEEYGKVRKYLKQVLSE